MKGAAFKVRAIRRAAYGAKLIFINEYKAEGQPVNGRLPFRVVCPVFGPRQAFSGFGISVR